LDISVLQFYAKKPINLCHYVCSHSLKLTLKVNIFGSKKKKRPKPFGTPLKTLVDYDKTINFGDGKVPGIVFEIMNELLQRGKREF
jgi:hypothetical protein